MEKSRKILILSSIILVGFFFSIACHYVLNLYFNQPNNLFGHFVWPIRGYFEDFFHQNIAFYFENNLSKAKFYNSIKDKFSTYIILVISFLGIFTFLNSMFFKCKNLNFHQNFQNIFVLTLFSYPLLMILDLGNLNMILFCLLGIFIYLFVYQKPLISNIFLVIINIINPPFTMFSSLYLFKKDFKNFFANITLTPILMLFAYNSFGYNSFLYFKKLRDFINVDPFEVITNIDSLTNITSLFAVFNKILCSKYYFIEPTSLTSIYNTFCMIFIPLMLIFAWIEKQLWKRLTLLIFIFLIVPHYIYDYKWIFLFIPIWLFANSEEKSKLDLTYTILFGFLLLPKPYGIYLNPLISFIFIALIVFEQLINIKKRKLA